MCVQASDSDVCWPLCVCVLTPVTVLSLRYGGVSSSCLLSLFSCCFLTHWVLFSLLKLLFRLLSFAEGENQGTVWRGDHKQRCVACKYADCSLVCTPLSSPSCNIHTLHYLGRSPPPPPPSSKLAVYLPVAGTIAGCWGLRCETSFYAAVCSQDPSHCVVGLTNRNWLCHGIARSLERGWPRGHTKAAGFLSRGKCMCV